MRHTHNKHVVFSYTSQTKSASLKKIKLPRGKLFDKIKRVHSAAATSPRGVSNNLLLNY